MSSPSSIPSSLPSSSASSVANNPSAPSGRLDEEEQEKSAYLHHMQSFWQRQLAQIEQTDFKRPRHALPLARIKKIMKSDEDVRMISAEAPVLFAKACELFILDLTMRAWAYTQNQKRRTLQRGDISQAIRHSDIFDFLADVVPVKEGAEEETEEGVDDDDHERSDDDDEEEKPTKKSKKGSNKQQTNIGGDKGGNEKYIKRENNHINTPMNNNPIAGMSSMNMAPINQIPSMTPPMMPSPLPSSNRLPTPMINGMSLSTLPMNGNPSMMQMQMTGASAIRPNNTFNPSMNIPAMPVERMGSGGMMNNQQTIIYPPPNSNNNNNSSTNNPNPMHSMYSQGPYSGTYYEMTGGMEGSNSYGPRMISQQQQMMMQHYPDTNTH